MKLNDLLAQLSAFQKGDMNPEVIFESDLETTPVFTVDYDSENNTIMLGAEIEEEFEEEIEEELEEEDEVVTPPVFTLKKD